MPTNRREESAEPAHPVSWLLASGEPAIRRLVRQDLLDMSDPESTDDVLAGPLVRGLFAGQRADGYGRWRPGGYWWKPPGGDGTGTDAVDWGRGGPNEMITLNALRVLRRAGRFDPRTRAESLPATGASASLSARPRRRTRGPR